MDSDAISTKGSKKCSIASKVCVCWRAEGGWKSS